MTFFFFFFSSRRRHTRCSRDWSSDVCSSDLARAPGDRIDAREDLLDDERPRVDELDAVREALEPPEVAVAARMHKALDRPPVLSEIDEERRGDLVPVPGVVPVILMVTADLAGVDVERDHRRRIETFAWVHVARPRRRIARAPEAQVEMRIVVPREPHGDAARLPGVTLPGLVTGLSGPRDRVGLPRGLTAFRVEGGDVAADAERAARGADHDLALRDQRRQGEVVTVLVVVDGLIPPHLAGLGIERDNVGIDG